MILLPPVTNPGGETALSFPEGSLSYRELRDSAAAVAAQLDQGSRVAVWAAPQLDAAVAIVGALIAGATAVPLNPKLGSREAEHIIADSEPRLLLAPPDAELPEAVAQLPRVEVDASLRSAEPLLADASEESPAFILYTSGTTGPPKGVVLPIRALASNLDALARAWEWTHRDVLVHALPFFHAHGLVLGLLGPLRLGGQLWHSGRFTPEAVAADLARGGTMLFAVPTMYHRLAEVAEVDGGVASALSQARLLVSGSAPLPVREHERIARLTGQRIAERYGLTETLMNCAVPASSERRPGYVGPPLPGVALRLVDESGEAIDAQDDETIGEVYVRGPNLFLEYLNRPDATAEAMRDGWFATGDLATRSPDGWIRIVGRRSTDLIKTGGYKVGAGEIEAALLEHPGIAEAAVTGEPDEDLGERIVAWIVSRQDAELSESEIANHVASLLTPHKRPRRVYFLSELPRTEMGKVQKTLLGNDDSSTDAHA
jgi:malonyl-CoA/methylmalonyl-CoA synthetase